MLMQIDRALAIYWNIEYKGRVSSKTAMRSCFISKIVAAFITFLVSHLDPEYNKCTELYAMFQLKKSNIYLEAYPLMAVSCILVVNSIYMAITIVRLDKKVHPFVTLPTLTINSAEGSQSKKSIPFLSGQTEGEAMIEDKHAKNENPEEYHEFKIKSAESKYFPKSQQHEKVKENDEQPTLQTYPMIPNGVDKLENRESNPREEKEKIMTQLFNQNKEVFLVA